jgi:hypothetical protein
MIIGNPYQFSIIAKVIKEWNEDISPFYNGIFLLCVGGELFPKKIATATLSTDVPELIRALSNVSVNNELFAMEKEKAFVKTYNATFPSWNDIYNGVDEDYQYHISPPILSDNDCIVFAVGNGKHTRILASKLNYIPSESTYNLDNIAVSEGFITNDELSEVIFSLERIIR